MSENLKVKWIVAEKKLIKFYELDDSYKIDESVNLEGIAKDVIVVMEAKDNIVVKMAVVKESSSKVVEEKKEIPVAEKPREVVKDATEPTPEDREKAEVKEVTWTISAITSKKDVVKFAEQAVAKYWYPIEASVIPKFGSLNKGDKVTIQIGPVLATSTKGESYTKDGVIAVVGSVKAEPPAETTVGTGSQQPEPTQEKQSYASKTNSSIEVQVALKEAGAVIRSYIEAGSELTNTVDKVEELIKRLTKTFNDTLKMNK